MRGIELQSFLILALGKCKQSTSHPRHSTLRKITVYPLHKRLGGPQAGLDILGKIKLPCPCHKS